jgi:purine-binding chemotaxis protein CheW
MSNHKQFCTFTLASHFFGIEVLNVQEIIRTQPMTRVPLASPIIRGLINLRGQIVTALDLRRRLGLPDRGEGDPVMNVVVKFDDGAISLLVDQIGEVVEVDETTFELPPETLSGVARDLVRGVYKMDGKLLLHLDINKAVESGANA